MLFLCLCLRLVKKGLQFQLLKLLRAKQALDYTVIVSATAADSASLQFSAPYTGCTYSDFSRDTGRHCLIIYDDLSKHAGLSSNVFIVTSCPPGREAYPGDVFYSSFSFVGTSSKIKRRKRRGFFNCYL